MKGLTIVKPITVTPSMLQTDVPEDDYQQWASGTTYALDERVIDEHVVWQSLQAGNLGNKPKGAPHWIKVSPTNRWKAFDLPSSTQTKQAGSAFFEITPGTVINALSLINAVGVNTARITMTDPIHGLVYDKSKSMTTVPSMPNWYTWYFGVRVDQDRSVFTDLPSYPDATIRVELTGRDDMALGVLLLGKRIVLGDAVLRPLTIGFTDYSRKETNQWGDAELQKRAFAETQSLEILLPNRQVGMTKAILAGLRATPTLWIATEQINGASIYGWISNFQTLIEYPNESVCSIDIQGLT